MPTVVEVRHDGDLLGALSVTEKGDAVTPTEDRLIGNLATQAGLVLRNAGLTEQLMVRLADLRPPASGWSPPRTGSGGGWNATCAMARSGTWPGWPASWAGRPPHWTGTRRRRRRC